MPVNLFAPGCPQVWLPLTPAATLVNNRRAHLFTTLGRVRLDGTVAAAGQELEAITAQINAESGRIDPDLRLRLTPLQQRLTQSIRPALLMLWVAVGLLLVVGAVITAQSLYSATVANAKEFAILLALGIPRWRISVMVLAQSFWVGVIGVALAYPVCVGLRLAARQIGADVDLRWEVLLGTAVVTVGMALMAGIFALRSVRQIEPMSLLR